MHKLLDQLLRWDQQLFLFLNKDLTHPFLDEFMPWVTDLHKVFAFKFVVLPILLGVWLIVERKKALKQILLVIIAVAASDLFSYRFIKQVSYRDRPSKVLELNATVRVPYKGRASSFPSNHAANNFAAAATLSGIFPVLSYALFALAGLVAYSRVYVGVHYPGDVLAGALIGLFFALSVLRMGRRWGVVKRPVGRSS